MNLVNPTALLLAGLAVPIVVFYILKIRLRRVPVSTLLFWQQIFEEKKPRSLWQRLRHLISLLLQLAFLALLVFALADPLFRWQQAQARRIVLVVDNSTSMNASDVAPTRLGAAKAEGLRLIDGMRLGDELAIIAAAAQPRVACGPTDHQRTLRAALDSIKASDGPTHIERAVALARRLLSGSEKMRRVVVLSDGGFEGAADLARQDDVELIGLGRKTANAGITLLQARRSLLDPIGYEILVEIVNAADEPASFRLELDLDDDPIDVVPLTLAPGERAVQVFEKTSADGGRLRARLDRADSLPADDSAWAILPRRSRQKVTLVTPGNLFLEKVFEAIPLVDLDVVKVPRDGPPPSGGAALSKASGSGRPSSASAAPIMVFHRKVPDVLPAGSVLVIEPERSGPLWQLGPTIHNPVVAKQDKDSPLMLHIRLDNVVMPEARKLALTGPARVLAESAAGDPLYAVLDRPAGTGPGKVVLLTVDLDKSDLPLQTAFPIMMANLLNWFGGTKGELREALAAGAVAEVELAPEKDTTARYFLRAPDGREQPLIVPEGASKLTVGPLDRCGVWSVVRRTPGDHAREERRQRGRDVPAPGTQAGAGGGGTEVLTELACNLADRRESDIRPAGGLPERRTSLAAGLAVRPIWYYLLASALMLTCWEWFLYQRRWID
ncbi:MAG: BatA and WFA domain-containing protein [Isosphaerales bacterium]